MDVLLKDVRSRFSCIISIIFINKQQITMNNNPALYADPTSAKRAYQTPELQVIAVSDTNIIATSTQQSQNNETLVAGSTTDWKF